MKYLVMIIMLCLTQPAQAYYEASTKRQVIDWTDWHKRFNQAVYTARKRRDPVYTLRDTTSLITIKITNAGDIEVELVRGDPRLAEVVKSLEHSEFLKFPEGSKRESITLGKYPYPLYGVYRNCDNSRCDSNGYYSWVKDDIEDE